MREEFGRCQIAKGLMGANGIVGRLPLALRRAKRREIQIAGIGFIELFGMGPVRPFDGPVELRGARRQDEQPNPLLVAGLFKGGGKLTAAIDLNGANGNRHPPLQRRKKLRGGEAGGAAVDLDDIPAGDDIARRELFEDHPGEGPHIQRIDLDKIPRLRDHIVTWFAGRIGP